MKCIEDICMCVISVTFFINWTTICPDCWESSGLLLHKFNVTQTVMPTPIQVQKNYCGKRKREQVIQIGIKRWPLSGPFRMGEMIADEDGVGRHLVRVKKAVWTKYSGDCIECIKEVVGSQVWLEVCVQGGSSKENGNKVSTLSSTEDSKTWIYVSVL